MLCLLLFNYVIEALVTENICSQGGAKIWCFG